MKFILVALLFLSYATHGQDCTIYDVTFIIKGSIEIDSNSTYSVQVPTIDYLRKYSNKKFDNDSETIKRTGNFFEVTLNRKMYDFYKYEYQRAKLPIIIFVTDNKGKSKKTILNISLSDLTFKFNRDGVKVDIEFDLGLLSI